MENLHSGVILKLLDDMSIEEKTVIDHPDDACKKPMLLQIRSIFPVLADDDLWPQQGFFMKVSDSTHAIYVSLSQEQDEMVLCNKLQLGQLIVVEKLEAAYPVPMLKGIKPIPGRQPCDGDPKDIVGTDIVEKICGGSNLFIQHRTALKGRPRQRARSISPYKESPSGVDRRASIGGLNSGIRARDVEKDGFGRGYSAKKWRFTDSLTPKATSYSSDSHSRTKKWCAMAKTRSSEISDSAVVKHAIVPVGHTPNTYVSPGFSARYNSTGDNSTTKTRTKDINQSQKPLKSPKMSTKSLFTKTSMEPLIEAGERGPSTNKMLAETEMLWDSLPSSLVKLGKEVVRQRDVALVAAVEALQEAAATESLLRCLSTFSELLLAKEDDQHPSINKFLQLQDYMAHCGAIVQSLTNSSPLGTADSDLNSPSIIREAVKLAEDRKRNATSWVKAAVASDLNPLSAFRNQDVSPEAKSEVKSRSKQSHQVTKLKGTCTIRKHRNTGDLYSTGLAAKKENLRERVKGSSWTAAGKLAHALQEDSKTWFLAYIENYLDAFSKKCLSKIPDSQVAESMCQIKRLNDWVDSMEKQEEGNEDSRLESSDIEAHERVRRKIYRALLKHVERNAMVLENMNATAEG